MARVRAVYKPSDYPDKPDETTARELSELFGYLFPGVENPEIDKFHDGLAIAARTPSLALNLAKFSRYIATELPWCRRRDLRELAIQALNVHFRSEYSFRTRMSIAEAAGIGVDLQRALGSWRASGLFNAEQRLVLEYTHAVLAGEVPDELFARVGAAFGEQGAIEFTALVSFWSFWAMFLNATRPESGAGADRAAQWQLP